MVHAEIRSFGESTGAAVRATHGETVSTHAQTAYVTRKQRVVNKYLHLDMIKRFL
jgi:hypothetical protein